MKKIILLVIISFMSMTASAQVEQGFRMGVYVNLGVSNIDYEGCGAAFGYGLGWIAEYNFNSNLYLQSGVGFENIAHKEYDKSYNAFYAQIPIYVGYRFDLKDDVSLFVQAGPTVGCGLFGSDSYFDFAKRFDLGIGGRVGVEFNKIQLSIGSNYGVLECTELGGHNVTANIRAAYMF